jgi:hypothetical protein
MLAQHRLPAGNPAQPGSLGRDITARSEQPQRSQHNSSKINTKQLPADLRGSARFVGRLLGLAHHHDAAGGKRRVRVESGCTIKRMMGSAQLLCLKHPSPRTKLRHPASGAVKLCRMRSMSSGCGWGLAGGRRAWVLHRTVVAEVCTGNC